MNIPYSKEQLMRANDKLMKKNQRYKQALKNVHDSLLRVQGFEPAVIEAMQILDKVLKGELE